MGGIHFNISLDGFSPESHGRFRGNKDSFAKTIETISRLSRHNVLQGLLVTPNGLTQISEYAQICKFAVQNGFSYVLMNPLSSMGRGVESKGQIGSSTKVMKEISRSVAKFRNDIEIVEIRFPNVKKLPLGSCEAGNIIYIFTNGDVAICPYLVFSARTPQSKHEQEEFIAGNIFKDVDIAKKLDDYKFHERYSVGSNKTCQNCSFASCCGKGCPAAIIADGKIIGSVDRELCPVVSKAKND